MAVNSCRLHRCRCIWCTSVWYSFHSYSFRKSKCMWGTYIQCRSIDIGSIAVDVHGVGIYSRDLQLQVHKSRFHKSTCHWCRIIQCRCIGVDVYGVVIYSGGPYGIGSTDTASKSVDAHSVGSTGAGTYCLQADLRDIAGLILDHSSKTRHGFYGFPIHLRGMIHYTIVQYMCSNMMSDRQIHRQIDR